MLQYQLYAVSAVCCMLYDVAGCCMLYAIRGEAVRDLGAVLSSTLGLGTKQQYQLYAVCYVLRGSSTSSVVVLLV